MKYRVLTKEQMESLHQEFSIFLASQQIDAKEWNYLKLNKPDVAYEEMQIFSDLVWEKVLSKITYLEHCSEQYLNLFKCGVDTINRVYIKINNPSINLTTIEGLDWLIHHLDDEKTEIFSGVKNYQLERNQELFDLIEKGSVITDGKIYKAINQLIA